MKKGRILCISMLIIMILLVACSQSGQSFELPFQNGTGGSTKNSSEVPEALLQVKVDEYIKSYGFDDSLSLETEITHNPDPDAHIDTISISITATYKFGEYDAEVTDLTYQYDKSNDNWTVFAEGNPHEASLTWINIEDLSGTYQGYRYPRIFGAWRDLQYDWWDQEWMLKLDDFDPVMGSVYLYGYHYMGDIDENYSFDEVFYGNEYARYENENHKYFLFRLEGEYAGSRAVCITPEEGFTILANDPYREWDGQFYFYSEFFVDPE